MTAAQRHDVRPARAPVRVLHLRHALVRQRGVRRRGRGGRRAPAGRRAASTGSRRCARAGPRPGATATCCTGPARLCQAFGIDGAYDGADLVTADRGVTIVDDGTPPPDAPAVSTPHRPVGRRRAPVALVHARRPSTCRSRHERAARAPTSWRPATTWPRPEPRSSRARPGDADARGQPRADPRLHRRRTRTRSTARASRATSPAPRRSIDPSTRQVLLLFHAKVQRWLQPGGHADGDGNLAARRAPGGRGGDGHRGPAGRRPRPSTSTSTCSTTPRRRARPPPPRRAPPRRGARRARWPATNHESEGVRWVPVDDARRRPRRRRRAPVRMVRAAAALDALELEPSVRRRWGWRRRSCGCRPRRRRCTR